MKKWTLISCTAFLLLLGIGTWWIADGRQIYTKTARQTFVKDPLFGTRTVRWKSGFWLGLDLAGPAAAALTAAGVFGLVKARRQAG